MSGWTAERVEQLAPDATSAKAGRALAIARHWVSQGRDDGATWGECQGSGSKPYQVRVDLSEPAFKCSCPSRKFPCKHAIGLMLMLAADSVATGVRPAWVEEWFGERDARAEKTREKREASRPPDGPAQGQRKTERFTRVSEGLAGLKVWLHDLVRAGIAPMPSRGFDFFDDQARRLVDAQAPGVARRVRSLANIAAAGGGWQRTFLEQLASLHLLIRGYERRESLADAERDVLLSAIGIARLQDEVLSLPPVSDRWQVIAQEMIVEDRLRARHTWLLGRDTATLAHVLDFAHGAQPFDATMPAGFCFDGEVCLYPGDRLRGLVKARGDVSPMTSLSDGTDVDGLFDQYAARRAANPWLEGFAAPLSAVVPRRSADGWQSIDACGRQLALTVADGQAWKLVALSGGRPIDLVVHFDGRRARPLAAYVTGEHMSLGGPREGEAA